MGQYNSVIDIQDGRLHRLQYNKDFEMSAWNTYAPKNKKYYSGERFFKVSRNLYPQYTRGYIYGYYEDVNYYKEFEELEREF